MDQLVEPVDVCRECLKRFKGRCKHAYLCFLLNYLDVHEAYKMVFAEERSLIDG